MNKCIVAGGGEVVSFPESVNCKQNLEYIKHIWADSLLNKKIYFGIAKIHQTLAVKVDVIKRDKDIVSSK